MGVVLDSEAGGGDGKKYKEAIYKMGAIVIYR